MPEPLKDIDRDLVRTLVLQGLKADEIIRQTGVKHSTLRTWILRGGWNKSVAKSREIRATLVETRSGGTKENQADSLLSNASQTVRNRLAKRLEQATEVMDRKPVPTSVKAVLAEQEAMKHLVDNAKVIFAWSDGSSTRKTL